MHSRLAVLVACGSLCVCGGAAFALTPIPYEAGFRAQIEAQFMQLDYVREDRFGSVSFEKLAERRVELRRKRAFLREHLASYARTRAKRRGKGGSATAIAERVARADSIIALERALELLDRLERETDAGRAYALAAEVLMLDYATRSFTDPLSSLKIPVHLWNIIFEWDVPRRTARSGGVREAANLAAPGSGGLFYDARDLDRLIAEGADLSRVDPAPGSPLWRRPPQIAAVDVQRNYLSRDMPMFEAPKPVELPPAQRAVFAYDGPHLTQSKPKLDVEFESAACAAAKPKKRKRCRLGMKLKFGMETHADPVANALFAALGYNADLSVHIEQPRVNLGKATLDDLRRDWARYFDRQRLHTYIPLDSVLLETGEDEDGAYVVFREAVAELRPREFDRIGFFAFSEGMAAGMREARGLGVLNAWIANADMKDEENNKLVLSRGKEPRMILIQQDIGHSLGLILPERVDSFPWDIVDTDPFSRLSGWLRGETELNYLNLQQAGLEWLPTYADGRWATRLIAQLSREQIEAAVALGGWPGGIGALYVEKLINRRNQLVETFDLANEFAALPVDRRISTADASVVDGRLVRTRWPHSSIEYGHHWGDIFGPFWRYLGDSVLAAGQRGLGAIDVVDPSNIDLAGPLRLTPEILVKLERRFERNPEPQSDDDQMIVLDTWRLGLRPRVGFVANAELALSYEVSIAYPVRDVHEAVTARGTPLEWLLPGSLKWGELPERYVLARSWELRPGLRVTTDDSASFFVPGADASLAVLRANRSIVDARAPQPLVWQDQLSLSDRDVRAFLDLEVVRISFARARANDGELRGQLWRVDADRVNTEAFESLVRDASIDRLPELASKAPSARTIDHSGRSYWWTAILWGGAGETTTATIREATGAERFEAEHGRTKRWRIIDNGEVHRSRIRAQVDESGIGVRAHWSIDDYNTHSRELDRYYDFAHELLGSASPLPRGFVAADWEVSGRETGRWTQMLVDVELELGDAAVEQILAVDAPAYRRALAARLGFGRDAFEALRGKLRCRFPIKCSPLRRSRELAALGRALRGAGRVVDAIRETAREQDPNERARRFAQKLLPAATRRVGGAFDPLLLGALLDAADADALAERGELWFRARLGTSPEDEVNTPEKKPVVGELGRKRRPLSAPFRVFPNSPVELYNALDWAQH